MKCSKYTVIVTLVMIMLYQDAIAIIAYDCKGLTTKMSEISLIDAMPCRQDDKNISTIQKTIQLIQPMTFDTVPYVQCLLEIEHFIFRCGLTIDTFEQAGYYDELYEFSPQECEFLIFIKIRSDA